MGMTPSKIGWLNCAGFSNDTPHNSANTACVIGTALPFMQAIFLSERRKMDEGYIKLYRSLLKWEWIDNPNVLTLFIHCLLRANYQDTRWQGIELKKGSFVTSYDKLSKATGLTIKQVRNGIAKLEQSGELRADKGQGKKPTIISVCKYEQYQQGQIKGTLRADKGHIEGTKGATDNNIKNINNINNIPNSNYLYNRHLKIHGATKHEIEEA